jgi:predicted membrane channel-forming protein YqfA (hemolysin III family)
MLKTANILFLLTIIQFWWIAIWGIAYILIDAIAGQSKTKEIMVYISMLLITIGVFHFNPNLVERL